VKRQPKKKSPIPNNIMMIHIAGTPGPLIGGAMQQSSEADHDQQSSSQPQDIAGGTPVDDSAQEAGAAAIAQVPQQGPSTHIAHGQNSAAGTDEPLYVMRCCGFIVHRVRPRATSL
jgi:hypothetical protein